MALKDQQTTQAVRAQARKRIVETAVRPPPTGRFSAQERVAYEGEAAEFLAIPGLRKSHRLSKSRS
jgi:hypothetical protein